MIPYDGVGYGKSNYWQYVARNTAIDNGEICNCWFDKLPFVDVSTDGKYNLSVRCFVKKDACRASFEKTDETITKKFKNFYQSHEQY